MSSMKILIIPILIVLYLGIILPLAIRQAAHAVVCWMDFLFDWLAVKAGFDPMFWPLPYANQEPLPDCKAKYP